MKKILVIGCGGAGMFSAIVATQLKPHKFEATILADEQNIYCRCTTPYIFSHKACLKDAIQPDSMVTDFGVKLVKEKAISINTWKKQVTTNKNNIFDYDYLVIATGASPFVPNMEGKDLDNVFTIRESNDVKALEKSLKKAKKAVIIGGGIIGVEMTGTLKELGISVSLVEFAPQLLSHIADKDYSKRIQDHLEKNNIKIHLNAQAKRILKDKKQKIVEIEKDGKVIQEKADFVIIAAGVHANTDVIKDTKIKTNRFGILVDKRMQTNIKKIYACGDVAVSKNFVTGEYTPSQLASSAIAQAKIVGYQMAGFSMKYSGNISPFAFSTLGIEYGGAGINEETARSKYKIVVTGNAETTNIYKDMTDAKPLFVKLIFAGPRLKLVGIEAFGNGVISHIETASLAIGNELNIFKMLKYSYVSHPSLTSWPFMNPIVMAAEDAMGKIMKFFRMVR